MPKSGFFSLMEKVEKGAGGSPKANKAGVHFNFSPEKGDKESGKLWNVHLIVPVVYLKM
jgi:hypothetical protein